MATAITQPKYSDEKLLTAEEFAQLPDLGYLCELEGGRIVMMNLPSFNHGAACAAVTVILSNYVNKHRLGRVLSNDTGVITKRGPDSVRGADVAFYSYDAVPKSERPKVYAGNPPELVFEVRSPTDRDKRVNAKVDEYLAVGVVAVCVVDFESEAALVHRSKQAPVKLAADDTLTFPDILGEAFQVKLSEFFD